MKEYTFEYTKQSFAYLLFGLSFSIIVLGVVIYRFLLTNFLSPALATISFIVLAVVFFLINKYKIKKVGIAKLSSDNLIMELAKTTHIAFSDLKYYYIYNGKNGSVFTLGFINGTKFKLAANNNFCNEESFRVFLTNFESVVETYKTQNEANIIHLESVFAKKQTVYILSVLTILVILGFCFTRMPVMILPIGVSFPLLVSWIRYFQQRNKDKLVDF
jgi:hypothetical protein